MTEWLQRFTLNGGIVPFTGKLLNTTEFHVVSCTEIIGSVKVITEAKYIKLSVVCGSFLFMPEHILCQGSYMKYETT